MKGRFDKEALAFDDVLLMPAKADVPKYEVETATHLTPSIPLDTPIISAAMTRNAFLEPSLSDSRAKGKTQARLIA